MATKKLIKHFTHPDHPLLEMYENNEFECDGCKMDGIGMMYRCNSCDFNLHESCATCPKTLSSFMHPEHELKLVPRENRHACNVCGDLIRGIFYKCEPCEFYVHPLCTQLPQYVRDHKIHHPDHPPLELKPRSLSSPTCCKVCMDMCSSWHYSYRCACCRVDIHPECVLPPDPYASSDDGPYTSPDDDLYASVPKGYPPRHDPYSSAPPSYPPGYGAYAGPSDPPSYPPGYGAYAGPSAPSNYPPGYGAYAGPSAPSNYPPGYGAYAGPSAPPSYPPGYGAYAGPSAPPPYHQLPPPLPAYGAYQYYHNHNPYYYYPYNYVNTQLVHGGGYPYHYVNTPVAHEGGAGVSNGGKPKKKKKMFYLVGRLAIGAIGLVGNIVGIPSLF